MNSLSKINSVCNNGLRTVFQVATKSTAREDLVLRVITKLSFFIS